MHSTADLAEHLARLTAAHDAHLSHISDVGEETHAELERSRAAADSEPLSDQIESYVPEPPADADPAG